MINDNQEVIKCIGCGADLQTVDKEKRGYTPKGSFDKGMETGQLYCQRCFKLRHYNTLEKVAVSDEEFLDLLHRIGDKEALIVNVVDIFDLSGSIISGLNRFSGNNPILLVANKMDLLPKSVNQNRIKDWLRRYVHELGLRPDKIFLTSGHRVENIDALLDEINTMRKGKDVYVVGVTNVGKSTLINKILQSRGIQGEVITTSQFPGTTLDQIEIPLDDHSNLIDTPGIIHRHQMASLLEGKELKLVSPQKEIKPRTFQLNEGQTIFLGGLARMDYLSGQKNGFTFYVTNDLLLHRTKSEGADAFYSKHLGQLLTPPTNLEDFPKLVLRDFTIEEESDLVISGLGWIHVLKPGKVRVFVPEGIGLTVRKSII